jgi:hypothetical protein
VFEDGCSSIDNGEALKKEDKKIFETSFQIFGHETAALHQTRQFFSMTSK